MIDDILALFFMGVFLYRKYSARKITMTAQLIKAKRTVVPQVLKILESIVKKLKLALEDYKYQSGMIPEMALPRS
jgi:hypothetical protein